MSAEALNASSLEELSFGDTNYNGKTHLDFRHCYELFDDDSASDFAELYCETLDWLS